MKCGKILLEYEAFSEFENEGFVKSFENCNHYNVIVSNNQLLNAVKSVLDYNSGKWINIVKT